MITSELLAEEDAKGAPMKGRAVIQFGSGIYYASEGRSVSIKIMRIDNTSGTDTVCYQLSLGCTGTGCACIGNIRVGLRGGGGVGMGVSGMVFVGLVLGCIEAKFCK